MRRLSMLIGAAVMSIVLLAPSSALAHAERVQAPAGVAAKPTAPAPPAGQPPIAPAVDDSTPVKDALTIVGFSVVAMAGLVLIIRAGLRSAAHEDED